MNDKRSQHELKRLVEQAVADVCGLPRPGLWFCVDQVVTHGRPPERFDVWATLHFLPGGVPFCCGEPGCHLGLISESIAAEVGEKLRHVMRLRQDVSVRFPNQIGVQYHAGVTFSHKEHDT